jgi:hypothetical protein
MLALLREPTFSCLFLPRLIPVQLLGSTPAKNGFFRASRRLVNMSQLPHCSADSSQQLAAKGSIDQGVPVGATTCKLLAATEDRFDGIVVDPERLPADDAEFARSLDASLAYWEEQVRRTGTLLLSSRQINS